MSILYTPLPCLSFFFFFFSNDTATTEIYTLSYTTLFRSVVLTLQAPSRGKPALPPATINLAAAAPRSEEHTSELQSRRDLVCRLLLEKKNKKHTDRCKHNHTDNSPK